MQIRILGRDLGHSGEQETNRDDFKTLVSDVAMGQVGPIFYLEASRLARSNKDWHRLLELCAVTRTLVFDGDGCYNPADFNASLMLWHDGYVCSGRAAHARARLHGGKLTKAQKGELHFPLRAVWYSMAIGSPSTPIRKCKARFEQSSNYLNKRAAPTA
ncbi:recombinase family protein [Bradyrhizobium sp. PMVTL-01]|uniref:recombinase family protein n=1 Tax=Bradyrhizobium sp. PMVTL-01 TaxID=3434999 RepID=UPI003F707137